MEKFITLPMFAAFILGVLLSAMVKGMVAQFKSHASGALGS